MRFLLSLVDHSALPAFPHYLKATAELHKQIDRFARLRMDLGASLAPCPRQVHPLGGGLLAEVRP